MNKKERTFNYLINLSFFLYFLILLVERVVSVSLSIVNHVNLYENVFNGYIYTLIFVSIGGWLIYLLLFCRNNIRGLFHIYDALSFRHLCIASGIILLSGMVHSEYTFPVIQFISYGILIVGILLKVIISEVEDKPLLWLSFFFLVSLSMAIPVVYYSFIELSVLFHIIESIASGLLVFVFTYLLLLIFHDQDDLFVFWTAPLMLVLDIPVIILRWNEEINYFVLVFMILTTAIFIAGVIYKLIRRKQA